MSKKGKIDLRKYIERVLSERDLRYNQIFKSNEIAVAAAFAAQEKSVAAAFDASEKAIIKSENAQNAYNARSNEFRSALDDQSKTFVPRTELMIHIKELSNLISAQAILITDLQKGSSAGEGENRATNNARTNSQFVLNLVVAICAALIGFYLSTRK